MITQNMNPLELVELIKKKNAVFAKNLLEQLEEIVGKDTKEYRLIRKLILDSQNNFSRMLIRYILGKDFEGTIE